MSATPIDELAKALRPLLPKGWAIVASGRSIDETQKTTVQIRLLSIERSPIARLGAWQLNYRTTISVPEKLTANAEAKLDDQVLELLAAIETANITWTKCEKVVLNDGRRLGYDLDIFASATNQPRSKGA